MECEVVKAKNNNRFVLIEMDANGKVGPNIIENDPNPRSNNGKLLLEMISRQKLVLLNAHSLCEGSITRYRKTIKGEEFAILDYIITCENLAAYLKRMFIDSSRSLSLTKFATLKGSRVKTVSDHNILFAAFNLQTRRVIRSERREIFDFKNRESQEAFNKICNEKNTLSECFKGEQSPRKNPPAFLRILIISFTEPLRKLESRRGKHSIQK